MESRPAVDWSYWRLIPCVEQWQAAALSLGTDPNSLKTNPQAARRGRQGFLGWIGDPQKATEFFKRLEIIKANSSDALFDLDCDRPMLGLALFATWALGVEWEIPSELADLADSTSARKKPARDDNQCLGDRAETTYLNIIGGLVELMLGKTPAGKDQSVFKSQAAIIEALLHNYPNKPGIAESTLKAKFAEARKRLDDT